MPRISGADRLLLFTLLPLWLVCVGFHVKKIRRASVAHFPSNYCRRAFPGTGWCRFSPR